MEKKEIPQAMLAVLIASLFGIAPLAVTEIVTENTIFNKNETQNQELNESIIQEVKEKVSSGQMICHPAMNGNPARCEEI